jgi:GNAT superfamily N-acetyltransferase
VLVRPARSPDDDEALLALWAIARPDLDPVALPALLEAERRRDAELILVAEGTDGAVVGTVTGAYDGARGWARKLSVDPAQRRSGVARALIEELERRFVALGALQVSLLVHEPNAGARLFWAASGYTEDPETVYVTKRFRRP